MKRVVCLFYVAVLIVLGAATFLDNEYGPDWSHQYIYGAWWFIALWWILSLVAIAYFIKIRERRKNILLLHASLLLILAGAFVSHLTSRSGTIHLRLFHPQNLTEISHKGQKYLHRLNYDITLYKFEIIVDKNGNPTDYRSEFKIEGEPGMVSMNRICRHGNLRLYQYSYDDDLQGSTLIINRDPYGIPITYCGYLLLFISLIYLCAKRWVSFKILILCLALTFLWCLYYFVLDGSWAYIPVLRSPLLFVHVLTIIMAYMLLLVQAIISAVLLIRGPRLGRMEVSSGQVALLRLSLCFLALGIFLGAIWANLSWGTYWSWDSKEVWALITFMIYAIPAHRVSIPVFKRPIVYNRFMLYAFLVVLMTYFGVNYCLSGLHSYA